MTTWTPATSPASAAAARPSTTSPTPNSAPDAAWPQCPYSGIPRSGWCPSSKSTSLTTATPSKIGTRGKCAPTASPCAQRPGARSGRLLRSSRTPSRPKPSSLARRAHLTTTRGSLTSAILSSAKTLATMGNGCNRSGLRWAYQSRRRRGKRWKVSVYSHARRGGVTWVGGYWPLPCV